jgi:hypothetical protein
MALGRKEGKCSKINGLQNVCIEIIGQFRCLLQESIFCSQVRDEVETLRTGMDRKTHARVKQDKSNVKRKV